MAQQFKSRRSRFGSQHWLTSSKPSLVPGKPMPSSGLCKHQAYVWCTDTWSKHSHTQNENFIFSFLKNCSNCSHLPVSTISNRWIWSQPCLSPTSCHPGFHSSLWSIKTQWGLQEILCENPAAQCLAQQILSHQRYLLASHSTTILHFSSYFIINSGWFFFFQREKQCKHGWVGG